MVGDSRAYSGDKHPIGSKVKIRRMPDGTLLGCSTTIPGGGEAVLDWWEKGKPAEATLPEHFTFLAVQRNGEAFYMTGPDFISGPLTAEFYSIGSGEQYAHGALAMGATAIEAVRIACKFDHFSDFPLYEITHRAKTTWRIDE